MRSKKSTYIQAVVVLGLLFLFLCGITGLSSGFKLLGSGALEHFFRSTSNPFIALMVGVLGTTLVQSSSVTTSMIVAMVAAPVNPLPIANAVPMIMGANIGTTVTSTLVALTHANNSAEFRRSFAAATCHDFFNFITVLILLPLELTTGILTKGSGIIAGSVSNFGGAKFSNPIKIATKGAVHCVQDGLELILSEHFLATAMILLSITVIFLTLAGLVRTLKKAAGSRVQTVLSRALEANPVLGILAGIAVTVSVQSSSITTSLMVPLAGAGIVAIPQVFTIILGANVGTTITALLATMAAPSETAHLAVQIALVHLGFNLLGLLLIFPLKKIRNIPIRLAEKLADVAAGSRRMAILYVIGLFYCLPGLLVMIF